MTEQTCIEFDDVVAGYGEFMILNNLSFKAQRGKITLLPANTRLSPMELDAKDVTIYGKVVTVLRRL